MQRLITDLFDEYRGKPILVIGGGPSVLTDLPKLVGFKPALVLSANEHGCKQDVFPIDYIVHCDKVHCMRHVPMAPYLRQFGKPLISRWSTADVRLQDWRFKGNSGTTAVAIAAVLGGSPIVVTGLDFWGTGRKYFYDAMSGLTTAQRRIASTPIVSMPDRRLRPLREFVKDAHVRPMSGIMTGSFPAYNPTERLAAPPALSYCRTVGTPQSYHAARSFHWSNYDTVSAGTVLQLTEQEAAPLLRDGRVAAIVSPA